MRDHFATVKFACLAVLALFVASPAGAQAIIATLPVTCDAAGSNCTKATPIVNPDGTTVAGGSGPSSSQLPASLGPKTGALSLSVVPNTDTPFNVQGSQARAAAITAQPVVTGGRAKTTVPTAVAADQVVENWLGLNGQTMAGIALSANGADATSNQIGFAFDSSGNLRIMGAADYVFNGTTWDRQRSAVNGTNTTGAGVTSVNDMGQCDDASIQAITENSFGNLRQSCTNHALVTVPYETGSNSWNYAAASGGISNTTTAVTIKAADATRSICILSLQLSAPTLGAATEVAIRDGAGGTVLWRGFMSTAGGNQAVTPQPPICGTANTLMEVVTLTATVTGAIYFNAQGFIRP
jgi:hypothetical protein